MKLKKYQKKAIKEGRASGLIPPTFDVLTSVDMTGMFVLKAVTGSGKTVIGSAYIENVLNADNDDRGDQPICIIWLSKGNGMLHIQSSDKIRSYIKSADIHIHGIENSSDFKADRFYDKDVYVINWEKLYTDNNIITESENNNIPLALKNTPSSMRYIFMVDEFHNGYEQETYKKMVEMFNPVIIIGMTATPRKEQVLKADNNINIKVADVQAEAMVKKSIKFNNNTSLEPVKNYKTQEEYFLRLALQRRNKLEQQYRDENVNVIPLLLIQYDDDRIGSDVLKKIEETISILDESYEKDKDYAVWMDLKKDGAIKRSDDSIIRSMSSNSIRILLFKQAIATGWDCPRAQVLLRYRKINTTDDATFDLQTLGRIFRMPEPERGSYYDTPDLNYGYVYATDDTYKLETTFQNSLIGDDDRDAFYNTKDYEIHNDFMDKVNDFESIIAGENNHIKTIMPSDEDLCEQVDRIVPTISWIKEKPATSDELQYKESEMVIADNMMIKDGKAHTIEKTSRIREIEVKKMFDALIPSSYSEEVRDQIITDIRKIIQNGFNTDERNMVTLENRDGINELLRQLGEYRDKHKTRYLDKNIDFVFPRYISISDNRASYSKKSLHSVTSSKYTKPEKIFIKKLEDNENVLFWYKNFDSGKNALCVAFDTNNQQEPTFPDFIVGFKDGSFGIYEIKDCKDKTPNISEKKNGIEKRIRQLKVKYGTGKFHGTLLKVDIPNNVVVDMDTYEEFICNTV